MFVSFGIGGIVRFRSRCVVMYIGVMCVGVVVMRFYVLFSFLRIVGVILNVVIVF